MARESALQLEEEGAAPPDGDASSNLRAELEAHTVKELRARAREAGVDLSGRRRKAEIVDAFLEARTAAEAPPEEVRGEGPEALDVEDAIGTLGILWTGSERRLERGDYQATLGLADEGLRLLDSWAQAYRRGMCERSLAAAEQFARRFEDAGPAQALKRGLRRAQKAYEAEDLEACTAALTSLVPEVESLYAREVERVAEILVEKERTLEKLSGVDADHARAHELLSLAEEMAAQGDRAKALEHILRFERVVDEALQEREERMHRYLESVETKLKETEDLGTSLRGGRKLLEQARNALARGDLARAGEYGQRCERSVVEVQRRHMEQAMTLRRRHYQEVRDLLGYLKPLIEEARTYGIDIEEAKTAIKAALDHLRQEEYFAAMEKGREARRFIESLLPAILVERDKRGVVRPQAGECNQCGGEDVRYHDDGWGECNTCGNRFVWSTKQEPWFVSFLKRRLTR